MNRVYKDKPGGLIVDYIGVASDLRQALVMYANGRRRGAPAVDKSEAVEAMHEKYEIVAQMLHGFDYRRYFSTDTKGKMTIILEAQEHILGLEDGKSRFITQIGLLSKAFALSVPAPEAIDIRDEVGFFQAVNACLTKFDVGEGNGGNGGGRSDVETETAIRQIVDKALAGDGVIDVFAAAGVEAPKISILSDEFLEEVRTMRHRNLALELLKKILGDELNSRIKKNFILNKKFSEMLDTALKKYQNNLLTSAQVIEALIALAQEITASDARAKELGLTDNEIAFYDALADNESARTVLGDDTLRELAQILVQKVKSNASIDWKIKESVQAKLRVMVKKMLHQYGYPPDKQKMATDNILTQAEFFADEWSA